ncbi:MAG: glycosyltransferase, partial [Caldilineaceae bacterium]|nr:glycosyltransferase [Caldilineaceae bacterium]
CTEEQVQALPDCVDAETFRPANAYDAETLQTLRAELGIPPTAKVIVYLGLLAPYQGTDLLLAAMQRILAQRSDVYLLLMGFPALDIYRHKAEELGVYDHVRLTGRIPYADAPLYLALGDVAVAPKLSLTESAGKLLNYMGIGIPTVAFDTPVAREYLGSYGLLARRGDQNDLADNLLNALARPDLGHALRQRAIDYFDWSNAGRKIVAAYVTLTGETMMSPSTPSHTASSPATTVPFSGGQLVGREELPSSTGNRSSAPKSLRTKWFRSKGMVIQE